MTTPTIANAMATYSKMLSFSPLKIKLRAVAAIGYVKFSTIASEKGSRNIAKNIQATLMYPKNTLINICIETERGTSRMS